MGWVQPVYSYKRLYTEDSLLLATVQCNLAVVLAKTTREKRLKSQGGFECDTLWLRTAA